MHINPGPSYKIKRNIFIVDKLLSLRFKRNKNPIPWNSHIIYSNILYIILELTLQLIHNVELH